MVVVLVDDAAKAGDAVLTTALQLRTNRALALIRGKNTAPDALYGNLQSYRDAVSDCEWVLQRDANNSKAIFRRGLARKHLEEWVLACADFERSSGRCRRTRF